MTDERITVRPEDYEGTDFTITQVEVDRMFRRVFGSTPPPSDDEREAANVRQDR